MNVLLARSTSDALPDFIEAEIQEKLSSEERLVVTDASADHGCENLYQVLALLKDQEISTNVVIVAVQGGQSDYSECLRFIDRLRREQLIPIVAYVNQAEPNDTAALYEAGFTQIVTSDDDDRVLPIVLRTIASDPSARGRYVANGPLFFDALTHTVSFDGNPITFRNRTLFDMFLHFARHLNIPCLISQTATPSVHRANIGAGPSKDSWHVRLSQLRGVLREHTPGLESILVLAERSNHGSNNRGGTKYKMLPYAEVQNKINPHPLPDAVAEDVFTTAAASLATPPAPAVEAEETTAPPAPPSVCALAEALTKVEGTEAARAFLADRLGEEWAADAAQRALGFETLYEAGLSQPQCRAIVEAPYHFALAQFFRERAANEAALMQKWMGARAETLGADADDLDRKLATYVIEKGLAAPVPLPMDPAQESIADREPAAAVSPPPRSEAQTLAFIEEIAQTIHAGYGNGRKNRLTPKKIQNVAAVIDNLIGSDWRQAPANGPIGNDDRALVLEAIYYGASSKDLHYELPKTLLGLNDGEAYDAVQNLHAMAEAIWQRDFARKVKPLSSTAPSLPPPPLRLASPAYVASMAALRKEAAQPS